MAAGVATATTEWKIDAEDRSAIQPVPRAVWLILGLALVVLWVRAQIPWSDFVVFWDCIRFCHAGVWEGIHDQKLHPLAPIDYPTTLFIVTYPLGYLPAWLARMLWCTAIVASFGMMYLFLRRAAGNPPIGLVRGVPTAGLGIVIAMVLAQRFLVKDLHANQLNMLTFAPACLALYGMLPGRSRWVQVLSVILLAWTAGIKLFSLAFVAMLWWKRAWWQAATCSVLMAIVLFAVPRLVLGEATYDRLQRLKFEQKWNRGLWLMESDSTELWSVANWFHYRTYVEPIWPATRELPPRVFQAGMLLLLIAVSLPVLRALLRRPWSRTTPSHLWEEVSLVGLAWAFVDPIGRTAHLVTLTPALGLIVVRRLEAWHRYRAAPSFWEWSGLATIVFTTLLLVRVGAWGQHHWYMHSGLFALGLTLLFAMTYREVIDSSPRTSQADADWERARSA